MEIYICSCYIYGLTTRKLRNDYCPSTHELQKDYGHITDGNYSVLHHFYDYVYGVIRRATLTFFGPYCSWHTQIGFVHKRLW